MSSSSATQQPALSRDQSSTLVGQTLVLVAATTGFFALGAFVARDVPPMWGWVLLVAAVICLFALRAAVKRSEAAAVVVVFSGLISVDFQRLRRNEDIRTAPLLAASIFLHILNVFLLFLNLFRGGDE